MSACMLAVNREALLHPAIQGRARNTENTQRLCSAEIGLGYGDVAGFADRLGEGFGRHDVLADKITTTSAASCRRFAHTGNTPA